MAELKIRKKRPVWPWIVIGIVIITIVVYLLANGFLEGEELESLQTYENIPVAFLKTEALPGTNPLSVVSVFS
ncbi:MAG: hypothetical protein WBB45_00830 [Cyclobacteriaceae bacterium]